MSDSERLESIQHHIDNGGNIPAKEKSSYISDLRARIRKYEQRYEVSSEDMLTALWSGTMRETSDVARWAWTWQTYKRLIEGTPITGTQ
jgi:hypothetical protein